MPSSRLPVSKRLLRLLQRSVDAAYTAVPRPVPNKGLLERARIVAHRGNTGENNAPFENTLNAFRRCLAFGVWGIEMDVQWTSDGVPVISHDPDAGRVFAKPDLHIPDTRFEQVRQLCPGIPSLEEVIHEFGGRIHLMIELKQPRLKPEYAQTLDILLSRIRPVADYHLLSLDPGLFGPLHRFATECFMPVAETNTRKTIKSVHQLSLSRISGHYLLLSHELRRQLRENDIQFGVGFIPYRNLLFREIHLGSDWIFTNHTARIQQALSQHP